MAWTIKRSNLGVVGHLTHSGKKVIGTLETTAGLGGLMFAFEAQYLFMYHGVSKQSVLLGGRRLPQSDGFKCTSLIVQSLITLIDHWQGISQSTPSVKQNSVQLG